MKKKVRKMSLSRETLIDFESAAVVGGATVIRSECGTCVTCLCSRIRCTPAA